MNQITKEKLVYGSLGFLIGMSIISCICDFVIYNRINTLREEMSGIVIFCEHPEEN
jgi:hypothetical protein